LKYLLITTFLLLCAATVVNYHSRPEVRTDKPILYWVTDTHEPRLRNLERFQNWLKEKGYPEFEVRIDNASNDVSKKLMQGISGVGADIINLARDEAWFLNSTGMLEDLGPYAKKHGFTPDKTWDRVRPNLIIDGVQKGFPRATAIQVYYVNADLLSRHGIGPLPEQWTHGEFERIGKAFVKAANPPGERQGVFFADSVNRQAMRRSLGESNLNETMTASHLDRPGNIRSFALEYQWVHEERILPSQADLDFYAGSGTTTSRTQLFLRGKYALLTGARYTLVQLREADVSFRLRAQEPPHDHFRNTPLGTGSTAIYTHSEHKDLAAYFLEYFTTEEHNMHVVREADAMPPIPEYAEREEFLRPPEHPDEWHLHPKFAEIMRDIAMPASVSPFILPSTVNRIEGEVKQAMLSGIYTPEEAAELGAKRVNARIQSNVREDPALREQYEKRVERQMKIERYRAEGKPVPLEWITNPFYREYYQYRGWSAPETE